MTTEFKSTPDHLNTADIGNFFGKRTDAEGNVVGSLSDLVAEVKALTEQDKLDLASGFASGSLTY